MTSQGKKRELHSLTSQGHTRFTDDIAFHSFRVQGEDIGLWHHPEVFPPSSFGLKFAEQIDLQGCRRAADIGTGTGLLAILAAKKGVAEIKATDLSEFAVRLTERNAFEVNQVTGIDARQGSFFCDLDGVFDVITANLPQEIIPPNYQAKLTRLQSQAIDGGGVGGNSVLLDFLDVVPAYMHAATKLYIIVNTITDYRTTIRAVEERFSATLVWECMTNAKSFVRENLEFFKGFIEEGIVSLVKDDFGNWKARQLIYRLVLKPYPSRRC